MLRQVPSLKLGTCLKRHDAKASYAIIRHNIRTYVSAGVVRVIRRKHNAIRAITELEDAQTSHDRDEGWRYFVEKTDLTPGMDSEQATNRRWKQLESRESHAMAVLNKKTALSLAFPRHLRKGEV